MAAAANAGMDARYRELGIVQTDEDQSDAIAGGAGSAHEI